MLQDFRLGMRRILRSPGFSVSVIAILAVGAGAAAAMGSVLNALAFRPLDLPQPETLVAVSSVDARGLPRTTPLLAVDRLRAATLAADGWCAYNSTVDATESGGRVVESYGQLLSGDCLKVIGIAPALRRWFTGDEAPLTGAGKPVMVITQRYWDRMFDRAADVLGRSVRIQNVTTTVIGVMPDSFSGFSQDLDPDFILPFNAHRASSGGFMFIGRLRPGASVEQLDAQVTALWPSLLEAVLPASPTRAQTLKDVGGNAESFSLGLSTLRRLYTAPVRRLALLSAALLLLVCVNVGGLMVARILCRMPEIAAMRSLGATSLRIARPLAAECAIFAVAGAALGGPIAFAAAKAFGTLFPIGNLPWTTVTTPDGGVFAVMVAGAVGMAVVIGALPIWLATRSSSRLQSDRTVSRATSRWAQGMLVAQVAVTMALVFTCGLIVRSFNGLRTVDRGYQSEQLLSLRLSAAPGAPKEFDAAAYYRTLVERVTALPGVESAGFARYFGTINTSMGDQPIGFAETPDNTAAGVMEYVSPGFFAAAGVPLVKGRDLEWSDLPATPRVAVVSESLARALAPDGDVVGRVIRYGTNPAYSRMQIVGVAGNLSLGNVRQSDVRLVYASSVQAGETAFATLHVKTDGPPMRLAQAASEVVAGFGREHVRGAYAEDVLFTNSMVAERMGTVVSGSAAALALVISCIGLFALLSNAVERRTREIGIRVAVGATPGVVSRAVIGDALRLVVAGLALGIPAAIGAASIVRSLLYEVSTADGLTLALSALLLISTGVVASVLPATRAARVDPATALRAE